jgi:hypothetical protein
MSLPCRADLFTPADRRRTIGSQCIREKRASRAGPACVGICRSHRGIGCGDGSDGMAPERLHRSGGER